MYVSIENQRFHGGMIRQLALQACIATVGPGELHEMWVLGPRYVRPGCTTALTLEAFAQV
jgi:hypothetical protein